MNIARRSRIASAAAAARCRQGLFPAAERGGQEALIAAALEQQEIRRFLAQGEQGGRACGRPSSARRAEEEVLGCAFLPHRQGAPGECDLSGRHWGSSRGRLPGNSCAAAANALPPLPPPPPPAARLLPASMAAKERQKSKVTKESVTLLPCFYFVELKAKALLWLLFVMMPQATPCLHFGFF
uniref:Uncharacterized protein n=1 Tax=Sphaerodactylus townsendi TaxID=933632 RepID=A0ACB8F2N5_9SAUR